MAEEIAQVVGIDPSSRPGFVRLAAEDRIVAAVVGQNPGNWGKDKLRKNDPPRDRLDRPNGIAWLFEEIDDLVGYGGDLYMGEFEPEHGFKAGLVLIEDWTPWSGSGKSHLSPSQIAVVEALAAYLRYRNFRIRLVNPARVKAAFNVRPGMSDPKGRVRSILRRTTNIGKFLDPLTYKWEREAIGDAAAVAIAGWRDYKRDLFVEEAVQREERRRGNRRRPGRARRRSKA